ncbi:MAG: thiamine-phosphate pyrophosphorylase [Candidatus Omnitrophota bacterium]|nr:thiamine-phosphate pyrophosphorylase [Candidatus Omnitrophota bacterium]
MPSARLFRVLDANLNRAREGLRVCEEVARLIRDDAALTRRCQRLRYSVDRAARLLPGPKLLQARDSRSDVGRPALRGVARRYRTARDLLAANLKRVQEALRVLEEFSRLVKPSAGRAFGSLRFKAYSLEQAFDSGRKTLRHR